MAGRFFYTFWVFQEVTLHFQEITDLIFFFAKCIRLCFKNQSQQYAIELTAVTPPKYFDHKISLNQKIVYYIMISVALISLSTLVRHYNLMLISSSDLQLAILGLFDSKVANLLLHFDYFRPYIYLLLKMPCIVFWLIMPSRSL